jgi:hypothetical protein
MVVVGVVSVADLLSSVAAPNLPLAPVEYSAASTNTFSNVLRLYFNRLSTNLNSLTSGVGGQYISQVYGAFSDSTSQTASSTTVAYPITFNATDYSNGVTIASNSRLTVAYNGLYNFQFSVQLENTTATAVDIDIWLRKNGTDIPASNSRFGLPVYRSAGNPSHVIGALNYFIELQATDYVELIWCTSDIGAGLAAYVAGTSPTRPAVPSIIATMSFVSALTT